MNEDLIAEILAGLSRGSLSVEDLLAHLDDEGLTDELASIGDSAVDGLDLVLMELDEVYETSDGLICSTMYLLDGACFSHRVTREELDHGVLHVTPDLVVADTASEDGATLDDGRPIELEFPYNDEPGLAENGSLRGPLGWLREVRAGDLVTLRLSGATIALEVRPRVGEGELERRELQSAFDRIYNGSTAVEIFDVVMDALAHNRLLFRRPTVPISELLPEDLSWLGAWVSREGDDALPPGVARHQATLAELVDRFELEECCELGFEVARSAWNNFVLSGSLASSEELLLVLRHGWVAPAFEAYLAEVAGVDFENVSDFLDELTTTHGRTGAGAMYLQALVLEREGRTFDAEAALRVTVLDDDELDAAIVDLAGFEIDRGNARVARALLSRIPADLSPPEFSYLDQYVTNANPKVGRNDPCTCGSGKKYKLCCLNDPKIDTNDRANWLFHKVMAFALRPVQRRELNQLIALASDNAPPEADELIFTAILDAIAFSPDMLERFVQLRGALLPDSEREMIELWRDVPPGLFQIVASEPGVSLTMFDTKSGLTTTVLDVSASKSLKVGEHVYGRILPTGTGHIMGSSLLLIRSAFLQGTLALLDDGIPDAWSVAEWVAGVVARPHLVTTENEELVACRLSYDVGPLDWTTLSQRLDELFGDSEGDGDGEHWTEIIDIRGTNVVRGFIRREDSQLIVETNSNERADRISSILSQEIPELVLVTTERTELSEIEAKMRSSIDQPSPATPSAEHVDLLEQLMREKEREWIDSSVPALGGMTPRKALADPTRREDLMALLVEFDRHFAVAPVATTFSADRIRSLLGISKTDDE